MDAGAGFPTLRKSELLERLAQGHEARVTVVTPNQRLSAALLRDFDRHQIASDRERWDAADVLPFAKFVERCYDDALYSELAAGLPIPLTDAQEQALWEDVIRDSSAALLSVQSAAALAREAWALAHEWKLAGRLKAYPSNDDARAFAEWAWRYEGVTRRDRHTERARLPDIVAPHLSRAALKKPRTLVAYGFDVLKPQQTEFFSALGRAGVELFGCGPERRAAQARRVALRSARDEILAAANWARSRIEADPRSRVGVVVPDLPRWGKTVRRMFAQVLDPGHALPFGSGKALPFDVSLGEPLASYPLVAAAFLVLEAAREGFDFLDASRLIRSPFIAGADSEMTRRTRLDVQLRKVSAAKTDLVRLRRAVAKLTDPGNAYGVLACPILSRRLADIAKFAGEQLFGSKRPAEWGKAISGLLEVAGFPGERALDSAEYQTLKKFHEAIAGFAALDRVAGRMSFAGACAHLARIAGDEVFQPEAPEVPIQILGFIEAAGMEFDHLWVMGLTDEAWPISARSNPLIPVALQRAAGVPESSAASSLELDRRRTQGWLEAAEEVVLSHPLREEDRDLAPSPLIREIPEATLEDLGLPVYESLRDAIRRARREERAPDSRAPALPRNAPGSGGTSAFADQAACPFRAFALHRLGAEELEIPPPGPDARDRGVLLHAMLAKVWSELKSKAHLDAISDRELDALLGAAADAAMGRLRWSRPDALAGRFAAMERERLVRIGRAWLEKERQRPAFEVAEVEKKRTVSLGGLVVNAKLDRLDRLQGGAHAILDYKTGKASVASWLGARPDEPQLPIYAVTSGADVAAVAFACVKAGEMAFRGLAREKGLIPGTSVHADWKGLLAGWRKELEALGREFASGEARVDPKEKHNLATCRYCEVKPFCRIYERYGAPLADPVPTNGAEEPQ